MNVLINLDTYKRNFKIKENLEIPGRYTFGGNVQGEHLRLFPFDSHPGSVDVIKDLKNVAGGFIRQIQGERTPSLTFDDFIKKVKEDVNFHSSKDELAFEELIKALYFDAAEQFKTTNLGTYKFINCNKKENGIAEYLKDTLCDGYDIKVVLNSAIEDGNYHAIEQLVMKFVASIAIPAGNADSYKVVSNAVQKIFYEDFCFMLKHADFAKEYISDILEHYYFYYTAQTCLELNKFFGGDRNNVTRLFYSIDWEKTSKSRPCYYEGWQKLQPTLLTLFSHAVTLEILNQNDSVNKLDYIDIENIIERHPDRDERYAGQIMEAAKLYRLSVHDEPTATELTKLQLCDTETKTEQAIRYLFDIIRTRFIYSANPNRANNAYTEKFELFCKKKILKNRKAMGLMLNLTDRNLLFLTKLCLKDEKRMRLNDVFEAFERRGIYLDTPSKVIVMNYYEKLNLIEKKSDSGDAQYVKGIL